MPIDVPDEPGRDARIAAARTKLSDGVVDQFVEGMFCSDTLVDALADDLADRGREGWLCLDEALRLARPTVDGAPASLEPLLAPAMAPPSWFDAEQVRWGAAVWWRFWIGNQIGLAGAVRTSYRFGDLNKPQAMNGRSTVMAARRYEETARWVLAVTEPGALVPAGSGFAATLKIRLVHAMIRRRLRDDPRWDRTAWGEPIHTSGMAVTNNAFLLLPLITLEILGMRLTAEETQAISALWKWIGYLVGVPEHMLPESPDSIDEFTRAAALILAPPDDDSRVLDEALMSTGIRAERALPQFMWPVMAPVLRPVMSQVIWGMSNTILDRMEQHQEDLSGVRHPVFSALRPFVARRERRRRDGALGSDFTIADRQRQHVVDALAQIKAAPGSMHPQEAMAATT